MRLLLLFVTLILGYCLAAPPEKVGEKGPKKTCKPGTTWKEECHSCVCTHEGIIDCSKEACPPQLVPRSKRLFARQNCKEGERWKEYCHNCICVDGKPSCTRELCESEALHKDVPPSSSEDEDNDHHTTKSDAECVEGDVWKDDCHTCHCTYGKKACTRELCPSESDLTVTASEDNERRKRDDESSEDSASSSEEEKCPPNVKEWKEDCNQCYCDKGEKVCTKALCPDEGTLVAIKPKE